MIFNKQFENEDICLIHKIKMMPHIGWDEIFKKNIYLCEKCTYEHKRNWLLQRRAMGRKERLDLKANRVLTVANRLAFLKELYSDE